jgi:hypothetical protein
MQIQNDKMPFENEEPSTVAEGSDSEPRADSAERSTEESLSLDLVFGILKNGRRRRVIKYLRDADEEVTLSDLAEHIAAIENDTTPAQLTSSQRKRVYVGLYQCHLPKMDDAGVIEYNQARGLVERTEQATHFEQYLDRATPTSTRRWYRYYGGASALGVVPFVLALQLPLSPMVVSGLLVAVLAVIGACSVYHWQVESQGQKDEGRGVSP